MKDLLGLEVSLGDTVAIAQPKGWQTLVISTVTEVDPDGRWIKVKGNANKKNNCLKVTGIMKAVGSYNSDGEDDE